MRVGFGIKIVGRSYRLRINYRTTDEIRAYAVRVLKDVKVDDLDGGEDNLKGYTSLLHGDAPTVRSFSSFTEEMQFIESILADESIPHHRTCLVARTQDLVAKYTQALNKNNTKTKTNATADGEVASVGSST